MPPTGHDYVTQRELDARLEGQAEMRQMVSRQIEQLMEGQAGLSHQIYAMELEIVTQMKVANGRTGHLEERIDNVDDMLSSGQEHITGLESQVHDVRGCADLLSRGLQTMGTEVSEVKTTVSTILSEGCHRMTKHEEAVETLTSVGALLQPGETARFEFVDTRNNLRSLVQQNPKKAAALGGGALAGLAALVPHFIEFIDWFIHLFVPGVK